jgi:hypothetical protein
MYSTFDVQRSSVFLSIKLTAPLPAVGLTPET